MNEGTLGHSGREKMQSIFRRLQNVNREIKPRARTYVCMYVMYAYIHASDSYVFESFFSFFFSNFCFSGDLFREYNKFVLRI